MTTFFSYDVRILMCEKCGAPMEVSTGGGTVGCTYCGAHNQLVSRKEEPVEPAAAARQIDEQQRLTMLRQQDGRPMVPPSSLHGLLEGGAIPEWKISEAVSIWQTTRKQLEGTSDYSASETLLFLTIMLSNYYSAKSEPLKRRAMFESALEVFTLPRHRQMIRGQLTRSAALEGDIAAAERWLAPCNPRSEDLEADTAYRISRATIDTAKNDLNAVLQVLGQQIGQVPIMDSMEGIAVLLRANACERLGQQPLAAQQLAQYMSEHGASGRMALTAISQAFQKSGWHLAAASMQAANASHTQRAGHAAAAGVSGGIGGIFKWLGAGMLVLGVLALLGTVVFVGLAYTVVPDLQNAVGGVGMAAGITGFTFLMMGAPFFLVGRGLAAAAQKAQRLRTSGIQARGQIVAVQHSGMEINGVPQMQITVNVQLPDRAPYQASTKLLLSPTSAAQLRPGTVVAVRVDPEKPSDILIETD